MIRITAKMVNAHKIDIKGKNISGVKRAPYMSVLFYFEMLHFSEEWIQLWKIHRWPVENSTIMAPIIDTIHQILPKHQKLGDHQTLHHHQYLRIHLIRQIRQVNQG